MEPNPRYKLAGFLYLNTKSSITKNNMVKLIYQTTLLIMTIKKTNSSKKNIATTNKTKNTNYSPNQVLTNKQIDLLSTPNSTWKGGTIATEIYFE